MKSMTSQPAKAERSVCRDCGISAPYPIVINDVCKNRQACTVRQRRPRRVVARKHTPREKEKA